jgi:hypothetical protein
VLFDERSKRSAVHRSWTGVGPIPPIEAAGGRCSHPRVVEPGHRQEPPGNDCDSTDNVICRMSTSSASRGIDDGDNRQSGSTFPLVPVWGGWLGVMRGGRAGRPGFRCAPTGFGHRPKMVPAFWARARPSIALPTTSQTAMPILLLTMSWSGFSRPATTSARTSPVSATMVGSPSGK